MNNSKKARIRQDKIRDMLLTKELISVQEFCEQLNASQATIRNDLTYLEQLPKERRATAISIFVPLYTSKKKRRLPPMR